MEKVSPDTKAYAIAVPSFLSLPGEVRNMIYRQLLVADEPLGCETEKELDICSKPIWPLSENITFTRRSFVSAGN